MTTPAATPMTSRHYYREQRHLLKRGAWFLPLGLANLVSPIAAP